MRKKVFNTVFALFLSLYSTALFGSDFEVKQEGKVITYTNKQDTVSYSSRKGDPQFVAQLKTKYSGLKDEEKLNELLKQQNYIEVLHHLWSESDGDKRLAWLEKKVDEGHPILMLELGEEYYLQNPTLQTYAMKTMPWLLAGARRTLVDADTTSDRSVAAAADFLLTVYQERVLTQVRTQFSEAAVMQYMTEKLKEFQKNNIAITRKVLTPLINGKQANMPSPCWVFAHGMRSFTNTQNTIPESQYNAIRKKSAEDMLDKADRAEKTL